MLKAGWTTFFILALAVIAAGQGQQRLVPQADTPLHELIPHQDSVSAEPSLVPPLSLAPIYGESRAFFTASPNPTSSFNNLLPEPFVRRPIPLSFQLLYDGSPYSFYEPTESPFRPGSWMLETKSDLLSPWKLQLRSQEKYQIWQSILGSVQAGGVAYLMYLHIKKYGLK